MKHKEFVLENSACNFSELSQRQEGTQHRENGQTQSIFHNS